MSETSLQQISLKVLIVGGGIGGLTAAISLRRQGHDVELFEGAPGPSEVGAAINMCPNASSVLKHLGVDVAEHGAVLLERLRLLKASGEMLKDDNLLETANRWQSDWRVTLRADLHQHLRNVATTSEGLGMPARLSYSRKVVKVDAENAIISFADGSTKQGDVLIGADGIHSVARAEIDSDVKVKKGRHSAFRFLVREEDALNDPRTAEWFSKRSTMDVWYSEDRKIVMYRCARNTLLNFVCIHPTAMSAESEGYNTLVDKQLLLDIFKDFDPRLLAMLEKADSKSLRIYPLNDMDTLPTFIKGRMALIGDAAHPFLPHLAQGGAMAIEDGASLGVMLSGISSPQEVSERLKLYNEARYERATFIQNATRIVGGDGIADTQNSTEQLSLNDYLEYGFSHDENHASTGILRKYLWSKKPGLYWRQSISFGAMPGPRQDFHGNQQKGLDQVRCTTAKIVFKTSATLLRNLLPTASYSFASRDTVAIASFRLQVLDNLTWLGGNGYNLMGFYIHNVTYTAPDGKQHTGSYLPVMFEDLTDPIVSGREELGFPKVYSDIVVKSDMDTYKATLSWRGATWAQFTWPLPSENGGTLTNGSSSPEQSPENVLVHRYMPGVGEQEKTAPDADYAVLYPPQKGEQKTLKKRICQSPAKVLITAHDWKRLPTLHHIVSRLQELPILEVVEASVTDTEGFSDLRDMVRL